MKGNVMSTRRISLFYNVEGGYWSDSNGNYRTSSMIPVLRKNEFISLYIQLVGNYGTNYRLEQNVIPHLLIHKDRQILLKVGSDNVNTNDGIAVFENADATKGLFVIQFKLQSVALNLALLTLERTLATLEFSLSTDNGIIFNCADSVYCENTVTTTGITTEEGEDNMAVKALLSVKLDLEVGEVTKLIEVVPTAIDLISIMLESPTGATSNIFIMNYEILVNGFLVYLSAPIVDEGYKLVYTYTIKE